MINAKNTIHLSCHCRPTQVVGGAAWIASSEAPPGRKK